MRCILGYAIYIGFIGLVILAGVMYPAAKEVEFRKECFRTTSGTYRMIVEDEHTIVVKSQGDLLTFKPHEGQKVHCPYNR